MLTDSRAILQEDKLIDKSVSIGIKALGITADTAQVTEYREDEGVYVYDLYAGGELVAKSRYVKITDAPFELSQEEIENLKIVEETPAESSE